MFSAAQKKASHCGAASPTLPPSASLYAVRPITLPSVKRTRRPTFQTEMRNHGDDGDGEGVVAVVVLVMVVVAVDVVNS